MLCDAARPVAVALTTAAARAMGSSLANSSAGRISETAFVVSALPATTPTTSRRCRQASTLALFALALLSVLGRFVVRLRLHRRFGADDACILLGTFCLIIAQGLLFVFRNDMYLVESWLLRPSQTLVPTDLLRRSQAFQKWVAAAQVLLWATVASAKFSFLFLFRKLIGGARRPMIYWWTVMSFNVVVVAFGIASYFVPCPNFNSSCESESRTVRAVVLIVAATCGRGDSASMIQNYSAAQAILDVLGDLMSTSFRELPGLGCR